MENLYEKNKKLEELLVKVDFDIIPPEIYEQEKSLENKQKANLTKTYGSIKNYLAIIYNFVFIEEREKSEVACLLGINSSSMHHALYNLGWAYSNDWDENTRLKKETMLDGLEKREIAKKYVLKITKNLPS